MNGELTPVIRNRPDITHIEVDAEGNVLISWKEADGAERYVIQRSEKADCEFKKVGGVSAGTLLFADKTVEKESIYWYRIVAVRSNGAEKNIKKNSEPRSINISSIAAPLVKSVKTDGKKKITFTWESDENADGYIVLRRHSFMKNGVKIASCKKDELSFCDTDAAKGTLFYYSVQSYLSEDGHIRYSNPSKELCSAVLGKTQALEILRKHRKKVFFALRLTAGADGYILLKAAEENGDFSECARTSGIDSLSLSDKGGRGEKGAYYCAAAYKKAGDKEIVGPKTKAVYVRYKL